MYLDIEEIANDPMHYQSIYARIKVLTEKGKELATVELPYLKGTYKITDIKGRTIHPDGTVIPLTVKPEDLCVSKERRTADRKEGLHPAQRGSRKHPGVPLRDCATTTTPFLRRHGRFSGLILSTRRITSSRRSRHSCPPALPTRRPACTWWTSRGRMANSLIWWNRLPPGVTMQDERKRQLQRGRDRRSGQSPTRSGCRPSRAFSTRWVSITACQRPWRILGRRGQALVKGRGPVRRAVEEPSTRP